MQAKQLEKTMAHLNDLQASSMSMLWELTAIVLVLLAAGSIAVYTLRTGISPMPSSVRARRVLLAALPERVEGAVYELGSGWGTLAFPLAHRYPGNRVIGIELSPLPWLFGRLRQALFPAPNLELRRGDIMVIPLGDGGLVVCYLHPGGMERLRPKLEAELAPGALVASNFFAVPGWRPLAEHPVKGLFPGKVYVYGIPPKHQRGLSGPRSHQ